MNGQCDVYLLCSSWASMFRDPGSSVSHCTVLYGSVPRIHAQLLDSRVCGRVLSVSHAHAVPRRLSRTVLGFW